MSWAIWITGAPGSGKSTLARATADELRALDEPVVVLELDALRTTLTPVPSYDASEREVVYRALVWIARMLTESSVPVIIDATGHRRAWRDLARATIARFAEVQLVCPIDVCREREETRVPAHAPRGIYARSGKPGAAVPGVDVPYEPALAPEVVIDTASADEASATHRIVELARRFARAAAPAPGFRPAWAIWLTGIPGAGKTTLAYRLVDALATRGIAVRALEMAALRHFAGTTATFAPRDDDILHRALVCAAIALVEAGVPVVIDATAHRRAWRDLARQRIAFFAEAELVCPLTIAIERERVERWRLTSREASRRRETSATLEIVLDHERALTPELSIHTDVQDVWSAGAGLVRLAERLHQSAAVAGRLARNHHRPVLDRAGKRGR